MRPEFLGYWCTVVATTPLDRADAAGIVGTIAHKLRRVADDTRRRGELLSFFGVTEGFPDTSHLPCGELPVPPYTYDTRYQFTTMFSPLDRERMSLCLRRFVDRSTGWRRVSLALYRTDPLLDEVSVDLAATCAVSIYAYPGVQGFAGPAGITRGIPMRSVRVGSWLRAHDTQHDHGWARRVLTESLADSRLGSMLDFTGEVPALTNGTDRALFIPDVDGPYREFPSGFTICGFPDRTPLAELFEDLAKRRSDLFSHVSLRLSTSSDLSDYRGPSDRPDVESWTDIDEAAEIAALREDLRGFSPRWTVEGAAWIRPGFSLDDPDWRGWAPILQWNKPFTIAGCKGTASWGCAVTQDDRGARVEISSELRDEQRVLKEARKLADADWRVLRPGDTA